MAERVTPTPYESKNQTAIYYDLVTLRDLISDMLPYTNYRLGDEELLALASQHIAQTVACAKEAKSSLLRAFYSKKGT